MVINTHIARVISFSRAPPKEVIEFDQFLLHTAQQTIHPLKKLKWRPRPPTAVLIVFRWFS